MYLSQAFKFYHDWWRYIIGIIMVIAGAFIFSLPHTAALMIKVYNEEADASRLNDISYLLTLFEPNLNLIFLLLPFLGGFIFLILALKFLHAQPLKNLTTSRASIDWKRVAFAFVLIALVNTSLIFTDYFMNPENYQLNFKLVPFLILVVIGILLIPVQTSFEEYLFRGYLMQFLAVLFKNRWLPLIITSVSFGLLHLQNPEIDKLGKIAILYYIGTGFFLGMITLLDEGLELALGYHAANNLVTAFLVTADWTAFQTHSIFKDMGEPELGFDMLLPFVIVYPLLLLILSKKYGWKNWKEKLTGKIEPPARLEITE
ncbi:CPBP family intramembrane glutamic endopeptidase [Ascidiimonas aurantiaca]|uniref:CPBP family intramembrane glutamic endopeptidase n=1 Tax=Ascidiimonas aurantiaca TaxID=1685432 RepID=UPI0030EC539A